MARLGRDQRKFGALELLLDTEWSSSEDLSKAKIYERRNQLQKSGVIDLSISHSKDMGGIFYCKDPSTRKHLGLDIETTSRVTKEAAERVSKNVPVELWGLPAPSLLWCAKEASFKAFQYLKQPKVISQVSISNWKLDTDLHTWIFQAKYLDQCLYGLAFFEGSQTLALVWDLDLSSISRFT